VQGERISLRTFLELCHVLVKPQGRSHDLFEMLLKKQGLRRRVQLLIPHFMSVPAIVAQTDLIVTVPDTLAEYFSRVEKLRVVRPPVSVARYAINQYWHERFHKDPAVQWVRKTAAQLFQKER
jgi:DNA-binding transcriptional LysR family regulator